MMADQRSYHTLGVRLLAGQGYSFDQPWYPFTPANTPTAHWSFLYPLFVATIYALFGVHPLAVRLVQAVLAGLLLPWLLYRLARRFTSSFSSHHPHSPVDRENEVVARSGHEVDTIPLIAAAIAAIYGYFILHDVTLMTETFYIITLLWSLEVGLRLGHSLRNGQDIPIILPMQLGLSLSLAALLRQAILPWVPVLFLWLLWQAWRGQQVWFSVRALALAGLIMLAGILPWTWRNYQVYGRFLLLNSNTGYALYSAQHSMHGVNFQEFAAAPLPAGYWGRSEAELDRELLRLGLQFILDDPQRYLLLSLSRVRAFFEFWPTTDTTLLHNLGRVGSFGLLLPFILYGLYLTGRDQRFIARNSLLLLFAAFYTLLHVLTWAMVRYRLPVDAVLIPLAALALLDLSARARRWVSTRRTKLPEETYGT
jgi:hypothetical protein